MQLIAFPTQCQNNIVCYKTTLDLYQKAKNATSEKIVFDCGNVQFFRPLGLNLLACFISEILAKENHPEIYFTPPKTHVVFEYIKNQGFFDCFQFESDALQRKGSSRIRQEILSTRILLKKLEVLNYSYIESVAVWLSGKCSMDTDTAFPFFNVTLVELIFNGSIAKLFLDFPTDLLLGHLSIAGMKKIDRYVLNRVVRDAKNIKENVAAV